jgi:hypothetical protein
MDALIWLDAWIRKLLDAVVMNPQGDANVLLLAALGAFLSLFGGSTAVTLPLVTVLVFRDGHVEVQRRSGEGS